MGGVAGGEGALGQKQGSLQGIAGVLLQNTLPRARVLYASATGASGVTTSADQSVTSPVGRRMSTARP